MQIRGNRLARQDIKRLWWLSTFWAGQDMDQEVVGAVWGGGELVVRHWDNNVPCVAEDIRRLCTAYCVYQTSKVNSISHSRTYLRLLSDGIRRAVGSAAIVQL